MIAALVAAALTAEANLRSSWASLGRDQGIFQYIAWAVRGGARLYRDVRDVNGPLATLFHVVFQWMGGTDEHRFRVLDLVVNGVAFAFVGACLASLFAPSARRTIVLAAGGWIALSSQYVAFGFWDNAQRESFADLFVLAAIGLQLLGQRAMRDDRPWRGLIAAAAAASVVAWFGKPTFLVFSAFGFVTLLADDVPSVSRLRRLAPFFLGGAIGFGLSFAALASIADLHAWARITFVDVPAMYRFIWPRTAVEIVELPGYDRMAALGAASGLGVLVLAIGKRIPRRALTIGLLPIGGLLSVFAQGKGFPYHFHPVTCGTELALLTLVAAAWDASASGLVVLRTSFATVLTVVLAARAGFLARVCPDPRPPDGSLTEEERLAYFERIDFFPVDIRRAAAYVAAHTAPNDAVQVYGMDPYLLFLAGRRSASPYIYVYDLNVDVALRGSYWNDAGLVPTEAQQHVITQMREDHEADLRERLAAWPPGAVVFLDKSPLMTVESAELDFAAHCPRSSKWIGERMHEAETFGTVHVWLPDPAAPPPDDPDVTR